MLMFPVLAPRHSDNKGLKLKTALKIMFGFINKSDHFKEICMLMFPVLALRHSDNKGLRLKTALKSLYLVNSVDIAKHLYDLLCK